MFCQTIYSGTPADYSGETFSLASGQDKAFNLFATDNGLGPVCDNYDSTGKYTLDLIEPTSITDIETTNPASMSFDSSTLKLTLSGTNSYNADESYAYKGWLKF